MTTMKAPQRRTALMKMTKKNIRRAKKEEALLNKKTRHMKTSQRRTFLMKMTKKNIRRARKEEELLNEKTRQSRSAKKKKLTGLYKNGIEFEIRKLASYIARRGIVSYEKAYPLVEQRIRSKVLELRSQIDGAKIRTEEDEVTVIRRNTPILRATKSKRRRSKGEWVFKSKRRRSKRELIFGCSLCPLGIWKTTVFIEGQNTLAAKTRLLHSHLISEHGLTQDEISRYIKPAQSSKSNDVDFKVLPWHLLPPDHMSFNGILSYYQSIETEFYTRHRKIVDRERVKKIMSLDPDRGYRGSDGFLGYVVYEFDRYNKVVLECPIYGNAVYLLYKNSWKSQARHSKQHIRENYFGSWARVRHTESWFHRVRAELFSNEF